ncbi:hypothetical protein K8T06_00295, partial [bacterium]|nr:hypothetical protein [bacterium]
MKKPLVFVIIMATIISIGYARFEIISLDSQTDFLDGKPEGIQINPDGQLSLSGSLEEIWCSETDSACWTLATASDGTIYAATGDDGKVFVYKNSNMHLLFDAPQVALFSLLPMANGSILAGSAPDGIIYKIDSNGKAETFARTESTYIWDMLREPDGNILVATGLPGLVIRIGPDGDILERFELKTDHVRTMVQDHLGGVWIGTASSGRIYQLSESDVQLVHDTHTAEISSIVPDRNGLWFSTVAAPSISGSDSNRAEKLNPRKRAENELAEHGNIWFMNFSNRSVREIQEVQAAPVFAMIMFNSTPVFACGNNGYLVSVDGTQRATLLASLTEQPLVSLICDKNGTLWA